MTFFEIFENFCKKQLYKNSTGI